MPKSKIGQTIASRELTDADDPSRRIVVSLGLPRQVHPLEWECGVHIDGLEPTWERVGGVDSMQALPLAVETLRLSLKRSPYRLAWLGDSTFYPAGGIPRQVPADLGEEFDERMEQLIERERQPYWESRLKIRRARLLEAKKRTNSGQKPSLKGRRRSD